MTYELAKQLKDAGFPQRHSTHAYCLDGKHIAWMTDAFDPKEDQCMHCGRGEHILIPTLSELIEACGDRFGSLVNELHEIIRWSAFGNDVYSNSVEVGKTPEEAVAKLWLELNKTNES